MTIQEELIEYSRLCLNDVKVSEYEDYISGIPHKWACQRFLNDLNRIGEDDFPYIWDEEEARKIIDWFALLYHSKGELPGEPINLTPHQKFDLCQIYGWRHRETGKKRFKNFFKEVARKNAKSQEEAGVNLYEISVQASKNNEIYEAYTAGTKRDQSKIIVEEAKAMLRGSILRTKFKLTRAGVEHLKTGSFLKPLTKDDKNNGDGSNPAVLTLDEYHQHPDTDFYDLSLGSNTKEPMLMIITTAGKDLTYPCYTQEYTYCKKILDPNVDVENDEYFVDIYEIDEGDDISNERMWIKANPIRMSYEAGREKIRLAYKIACEIPEKMTAFLTKCLNKWVQAKENGYMDMAKWKRCEVKELPIDIRGRSVYVGFDMSAKIDLTSVSFVIPYELDIVDKSGKPIVNYIVSTHSFIPNRQKLMERVAKDKVPYDAWERQGYLSVTDSEIVDQSYVMEYVLKICRANEWNIECLCFDPANASKLMMDLSNEGYDVEEVYQSHRSLNESTAGFREQVYCKNVAYLKNPLLNYAMSNAVVKTNQGLIKIDKDATNKRIDPVDAILCAFKLALYHEFAPNYMAAIDAFLESE